MEAYGGFVKGQLRGGSVGASLSYNSVANDLESVNYSSLKAGRLEEMSQYKWDQTLITEQLMRPWFEDWLPYAILTGKIQMPITKRQKILDGEGWLPRVWESVEPLKEAQADVLEIGAGLSSRRLKVAERGGTVEEIDEERAEDKASEKLHGLEDDPVKPIVESEPEGEPDGEPVKDQ
jgi:lambda family phage portal protein